jgi:hypothetical protein
MLGEFFQEFLVAEEWVGRPRGFEHLKEGKLFFRSHRRISQNSWSERPFASTSKLRQNCAQERSSSQEGSNPTRCDASGGIAANIESAAKEAAGFGSTQFMSGYADDATVRHGILTDNSEFLQKPFTSDTLLRKIDMILSS